MNSLKSLNLAKFYISLVKIDVNICIKNTLIIRKNTYLENILSIKFDLLLKTLKIVMKLIN